MRGRPSPLQIVLTPTERRPLEQLVRSPTAPHGLVQRARMVLKFADGVPIAEITRQLEVQRRIVREWLKRYAAHRLDGLHDLPRSGRPPAFSPGGGAARRQDRVRAA